MAGYNDGSIVLSTKVDTKGISSGLNSIKGTITKIGAAIGVAFGVRAIVNFGKEAINLASDLEEVQNVVDVAFGDMSYKIEEFSKKAIQNFGISELAAKKTASTYMAMGKGMGIAEDVASDMAITMTGLTADIASFYNLSQERADVVLKSVYTGETEALKQLGIVMTDVNLKQFAATKGITKNISAMSQQEKTMLRYQYVLEQTKLASGDFARTQDSWANQTRILSERWKEMSSIFGQIFIRLGSLLLPTINKMIEGLTNVANILNTISQRSYALITGKTLDLSNKQADATANAVQNQDQLTDSINNTNDALEKSVAGFDKVEILSGGKSKSGSGGTENLMSDTVASAYGEVGKTGTTGLDGVTSKITGALEYIVKTVELSLVAIGLILLATGDIPWGVGFIIAGAYLYSVTERAQGAFDFNIVKADIQTIVDYLEEALVALGVILLFLGQIGWGIGFIIAGAVVHGVKEANQGDYDEGEVVAKLATIMEAVSLSLVGIGVILMFAGHMALGIGFIYVGAKLLDITEQQLQESGVTTKIQEFVNEYRDIIEKSAYALIAIGMILLALTPLWELGIGLIATGIASLVLVDGIFGDSSLKDVIAGWFGDMLTVISGFLLCIGVLLMVGGNIPMGIGCVLVGLVGLVAAVAPIWDELPAVVLSRLQTLAKIVASFGLAIGVVLLLGGHYAAGFSLILGSLGLFWLSGQDFGLDGSELENQITDELESINNAAENGVNRINGTLSGIRFSKPGQYYSTDFSIPSGTYKVPGLAKGAVIPPNREFLAVLGDQRSGTNIEAPLDTIVQAMNIALAQNGYKGGGNTEVILELDGRAFGRAVVEQGNRENRRIGTRLVTV